MMSKTTCIESINKPRSCKHRSSLKSRSIDLLWPYSLSDRLLEPPKVVNQRSYTDAFARIAHYWKVPGLPYYGNELYYGQILWLWEVARKTEFARWCKTPKHVYLVLISTICLKMYICIYGYQDPRRQVSDNLFWTHSPLRGKNSIAKPNMTSMWIGFQAPVTNQFPMNAHKKRIQETRFGRMCLRVRSSRWTLGSDVTLPNTGNILPPENVWPTDRPAAAQRRWRTANFCQWECIVIFQEIQANTTLKVSPQQESFLLQNTCASLVWMFVP